MSVDSDDLFLTTLREAMEQRAKQDCIKQQYTEGNAAIRKGINYTEELV